MRSWSEVSGVLLELSPEEGKALYEFIVEHLQVANEQPEVEQVLLALKGRLDLS